MIDLTRYDTIKKPLKRIIIGVEGDNDEVIYFDIFKDSPDIRIITIPPESESAFPNIYAKINLNSEGIMAFSEINPNTIFLIGVFVVALIGGSIGKNGLKTDGLQKAISDFLDRKEKRRSLKILNDKFEKLNVKKSKEIIEFFEVLNKERRKLK